jgi:hypothetical protein
VHEPERARPPGNRCCTTSSKFRAAAVEGLLERLADAAVGLLDEALQLGEALSRSARWVSSSSTCATASSYSCLASGLTGPSCSRRPHEALDALGERLALLVGQRLGGGLGLEAEAAGDAGQVALGVGRGVRAPAAR